MKLLFCPNCGDVVRLIPTRWRRCVCRQSGGQYNADGMTATAGGKAHVLGIGNFFFHPDYPRFDTVAAKKFFVERVYPGFTYTTDGWWGDYPGEAQLFHIKAPNGPRLRIQFYELESQPSQNVVIVVDGRKFTTGGLKKDISGRWWPAVAGRKGHQVVVPANPHPSFRGKKRGA